MSARIVLRRSLQLVPRSIYKAPKHGLQRQGLDFAHHRLSTSAEPPPTPSAAPDVDNQLSSSKSIFRKVGLFHWKTNHDNPLSAIKCHGSFAADPVVVDRAWLRDACPCEKCVDHSSGQKRHASTDVPTSLPISALKPTEDGGVQIHFELDFSTGGTHVSTYPRDFWSQLFRKPVEAAPKTELWNQEMMVKLSPYFSYETFMAGGAEYRQAMTTLSLYGLIFLDDVPSSEEAVKDIAGKIGVIQNTFYGTTWDVKSKPNAENVAYTNSYLGLHQDMLYLREVPRIQILHCLQNTCEGGDSLFSDSSRAAHQFRKQFPEEAESLTRRHLTYHYDKGGHSYQQSRPVLSYQSKPTVYWSPPFQSPIQPDELTRDGAFSFKQWHKGAKKFQEIFASWDSVYQHKMRPGQCSIFDNPRVLHGRLAFDSNGERWLKGTYVDSDSYESRLKSLNIT
ncbi:hypothetical protein EKO27_g1050 [Xylaria grammica]|uniref:TauD/TfdA-like domain-containing protein n=1 Tax=Xylaria grammica TaxID=363999 RepID=A0A439DI32_9PEZI|nr:hypothetical protein EKO27_g1050 [Xylaria grammica]